ncbi:hypothetical protein EVAR_91972_1 [Eumeta japonica]|uniref:Uncharacterized protein n=1 Tax=Eumeta variegata TaxID=151549 RepID=A0A4C2A3K9_EUMVA|nr:hypothetical protein EVAR_91972_1 [Eumeta japonica]
MWPPPRYATRRGEGRAPPKGNAQIHKKIGTAIILEFAVLINFYTADRGLSFSLGSHRMGTTVSDPRPRVRKIRLIIYPRAAPPGGRRKRRRRRAVGRTPGRLCQFHFSGGTTRNAG